MQFDLRVNDGTPTGTIIRNQAVVRTAELPSVLTDGDGNPLNDLGRLGGLFGGR